MQALPLFPLRFYRRVCQRQTKQWLAWPGCRHKTFLGGFLLCLCLWLIPVTGSAFLQPTPLLAQGTIPNPLANITQVAIGGSHTCALTTSGDVRCWGADLYGQLGDGGSTDKLNPVAVGYLNSDVRAVSAGWQYTCALSTSSGVMCWGNNDAGQLGNAFIPSVPWPISISELRGGIAAISTGEAHACALTADAAVLCWGNNDAGQLGNGTTIEQSTPIAAPQQLERTDPVAYPNQTDLARQRNQ